MKGPQRIAPGAHPVVQAIGQELKARGMSVTELAHASGVERSIVSGWFRCRTQPTLRSMEAVMGVLDMTVAPMPVCQTERATQAADWLQAQGWTVEPPSKRGDFW